ncbi:hypothetical protein A5886_000811 [Enterococcus sp. 8G7_MSG3316]|uniref:Uncharacterized protein n=1 Tax=Candidatus Enterococcus testudinis TaxID=1834191 RepID=A0A242A3X3_9ENTE|nr:hypothetical protein A5886_000811 [Enterococcus sp. 8G7_MSG3316]
MDKHNSSFNRDRIIIRRLILFLVVILLIVIAGGWIFLNNLTIAENWFGLSEYDVVENRHQWLRLIPYILISGIIVWLIVSLMFGLKKQKKSIIYWLTTMVLLPLIAVFVGIVSTWLPVDRHLFREADSAENIMAALPNQASFKGKDIQLISYSFHVRNVPLKSGIYAVARIINPNTNLQDEYWYYPTNLLSKWKKEADTITLAQDETIDYDAIDWGIIPTIIKDAEKRAAQLDHYLPGVSIVILNGSQGEWTWTVGVNGIRDRTEINYVYALNGDYLSEWK